MSSNSTTITALLAPPRKWVPEGVRTPLEGELWLFSYPFATNITYVWDIIGLLSNYKQRISLFSVFIFNERTYAQLGWLLPNVKHEQEKKTAPQSFDKTEIAQSVSNN